MSAFEFVLVAFAIILGFGIAEILEGWGQQVRARATRKPFPLQIASSALILFFGMQYLWGLWLIRDLDWTFPLYFLFSIPALAVALAAHITRVDVSADAPSASVQYFENARPVYSFLAFLPIVLLVASLIPGVRGQVQNAPNLIGLSIARVVLLALILSLAWSKNERYHAACIGIVWLSGIALVTRLAFSLGAGTG